jgi:hypothetical protein
MLMVLTVASFAWLDIFKQETSVSPNAGILFKPASDFQSFNEEKVIHNQDVIVAKGESWRQLKT